MSEQPQSLAEISEVELVRRAQAHDDAAFQELMRRTKSSSMRLALSILKNREEAEDQVQNSFLNAWKNLGSFHLEAKFSTWMRTIVSNQSLMFLRSRRKASIQPLDAGREDGSMPEPPDTRADQEQSLGRREISEHLRAEVKRLPPLFREILELRDLQEIPMDEVAAQLGVSKAAAKSRLARARQMLRERMQRHSSLRVIAV